MWYDGPPAAGAAAAASCHARGSRRRGVPCWLASSRRCRYPPGACGAPAAAGSSSAWRCRARAAAVSARASRRVPPRPAQAPGRREYPGMSQQQGAAPGSAHAAGRQGWMLEQAGHLPPAQTQLQQPAPARRRLLGSPAARMWQARRVTGNALGDSPCLGRPARRCAPSTRSPAATAQTSRSGGMQSDDARCADGRPAHMACRIG